MLERLHASQSERNQQVWAKLIWLRFKRYDPEQVNAVITASQNSLVLKAEFASLIDPIELGSPAAEQAIASYLEDQKWQKLDKPQSLLEPPPRERILTLLDKLEAGEPASWWCLCHEITLKPDSTHYGELLESDLTTLPGWTETEATTKARIVEAAKAYIRHGDPETQTWLGMNIVDYPALAGYKALRLLRQEEPEFISTISVDAWKKWTPIILDYPKSSNETDEKTHRILVRIAYQNAPIEVINTLMILIDQENQENGSISINRAVKECWDERLASAILNKVQDKQLNPKSIGCLLEDLLIHKVDKAKTFAESLIPLPPPIDGEERVRALTAARALMNYAEDAGWSVVWLAIQQDSAFGREVIEAVSFSFIYTGSLEQRLKEEYLADLYIFLIRQYPHAEENEQDDVTGSRDDVIEWRKYIPQRLKDRGTPQACEALRRIISELPKLKDKLKWMLLEAEALARRQTWKPLQPAEFLNFVADCKVEIQPIQGFSLGARAQAQTINAVMAQPQPIKNRWALLVGVNRYVDPNISSLKFCVYDVLALEQVLKELGYTVLCLHDQLDKGNHRFPNRDNVEAELTQICEAVEPDDLLLVHFAGHGKLVDGHPVLLLQNTRLPTLAKTGLPLAEVREQMRKSRARRLVLTLDACHTGVEIGRDIADPQFIRNAYELAEGFALIAASTAQQIAQEWREREHGVFTYYLLEGLSGKADRGNKKFVTVDDLKTYVLDGLHRWRVEYSGAIQEPTAQTEGLGDMILADYRDRSQGEQP